jgi:hypothetical protein
MAKHGDTHLTLIDAVELEGEPHARMILKKWSLGKTVPRWKGSFDLLNRIESHYGLRKDHFKDLLNFQSPAKRAQMSINAAQRHLVRWHLPDDFDFRSAKQQGEILEWIERNVLTGATDFGKYIRHTARQRFRLRFSELGGVVIRGKCIDRYRLNAGLDEFVSAEKPIHPDAEVPQQLVLELDDLVKFKRSTIATFGYQRYAGWSAYTAELRANTYGRFFGAMMASPRSEIAGLGVARSHITMGLMAFPRVWDWYLRWAERRRGFYTKHEFNTLTDVVSLLREHTGWIRQHPELAFRLAPIPNIVTRTDIRKARRDWASCCGTTVEFIRSRLRELRRIYRPHRDPFEPILPVLNSDSPLSQYRRIADEILRNMPDEKQCPLGAAEAVRDYLMFRFGMHLGFRQRNFRELRLCMPGHKKTGEFTLREMRCGEIRWSEIDSAWEVFVPSQAFKNWDSFFFKHHAFRHLLPNLENLYFWIDAYINRHRPNLLRGRADPGTFFVRKMRLKRTSTTMDSAAFYFAWRDATARFGIYNPYTKRGAIKGILPHGPHAVRDVLATHVLKQTASYDLAAFAIQDTPDMVKAYYGRFLPEEKVGLAAKILNRVWEPS